MEDDPIFRFTPAPAGFQKSVRVARRTPGPGVICGRVDPGSGAQPIRTKRLVANMNHMHLIDPASGAVL